MTLRKKSGNISLLDAIFLLFTGVGFLIALAPDEASSDWSAIAEEKTSYTTDAFQFSSARRLRLSEDPSQPTVVPLNKPEDLIWEPGLEIIHSSTAFGKNEFSLKARGAIYTNNPTFNHGDYRIQDRYSLDADTSVLLRYRYVPHLLLGPNVERRTGSFSIQEERVTSHHWRTEIERRLTDQTSVTMIGRYGERHYNEAFAERDTHFYTVGPRLHYEPLSWMVVSPSYLYERGVADGSNEPEFKDDVSYYLHLVSIETQFQVRPGLSLDLTYTYVQKTFTSGIPGDPHEGRVDRTHQGLAELRYHFTPKVTGTLSFQRTQRSSTNVLRDFNDSIMSLGGECRF